MTTLLLAFLLAWALGLFLTPVVRRLGVAKGAMDVPDARKTHTCLMPRNGGMAVVVAHALGLGLTAAVGTRISALLVGAPEMIALWCGAGMVFGVGLWDDFRSLSAKVKLLFQIAAGSIAFAGGVAIAPEPLVTWIPFLAPGVWSYAITLFWFLLLVNAVNLIDGLDGLAAGIGLFVCLVLAVLQVITHEFLLALYFVTLAGSLAGFLRYNFNPATIFLGDGGSYYLGFMVAGLSILGSVKSEVGAALTLPLLAMGVPVFDTVVAPIRRFVLGRAPFQPDNHHLHHKLLARGLSSNRVVLLLYSVTAGLCVSALVLVNLQDEQRGLVLVLLGVGVFLALNGLGYFRYVDREKVGSWFRDMGFVTGLHQDRRRFLDLQVRISRCATAEELWETVQDGLVMLDFDHAEMRLVDGGEGRTVQQSWTNPISGFDIRSSGHFKLELPLQCPHGHSYGELWLVKDLHRSPMGHYTLSRIEHLRRAIMRCIMRWG